MSAEEAVQAALESAVLSYEDGAFEEAERECRSVIARDPALALEGNQLLGLILASQGRMADAAAAYETALHGAPGHPGVSFGLGYALSALGRQEEALPHLERAASAAPDFPEAHRRLGDTLAELGRALEAISAYERTLALDPNDVTALLRLGNLHLKAGAGELAAASLRRVLALEPDNAWVHYMLGNAQLAARRLDEAGAAYQKAAELKPGLALAHLGLGRVRFRKSELEGAEAAFRRALELDAGLAEAHNNLGTIFGLAGLLDQADARYREAIAVQPGWLPPHLNLGNVLFEQRRVDEAEAKFRHALAADPDNASAHYCLGLIHLLGGNYQEGWKEYEWRWRLDDGPRQPQLGKPQWRGEDLAGKTIFLWAEQGMGDTLQFVRYAPLVAERGGRVILRCQKPLARLLQSVAGVDRVLGEGTPAPDMDLHCPLMSLPLVFGTTVETIPARMPYLRVEPERAAHWRAVIDRRREGTLAVGLVWAGMSRPGPSTESVDRRRSMSLAQLEPLAGIEGVSFYSLQKGRPGAEAARPPSGMTLIDHTAELGDFLDTAGLVAHLDLVITVDTSVAHLAGGMGKPVWILSRFDGCWRWLDREESPWYPTARVFRQGAAAEWAPVVERIAQALRDAVRRKS